MTGGSITASLDRIEAVLDRLEAAAREAETMAAATPALDASSLEPPASQAPVVETPGAHVDEATHADLDRRHAQLRSAVSASLARLDTLIAREDT